MSVSGKKPIFDNSNGRHLPCIDFTNAKLMPFFDDSGFLADRYAALDRSGNITSLIKRDDQTFRLEVKFSGAIGGAKTFYGKELDELYTDPKAFFVVTEVDENRDGIHESIYYRADQILGLLELYESVHDEVPVERISYIRKYVVENNS